MEKMNILKKLSEVQTQIKAPKNMYNSYGKYNYRNAEGIFEAVKPYLAQYNLALVMVDDVELIGEKHFLKSTATLFDVESGDTISNHAYAEIDSTHKGMSADQITGCCSSYCRKYCLNAMFLLDDTKDADSSEYKDQNDAQAKKKQKSEEKKPAKMAVIPCCERCGGEIKPMPTKDGEMSANAVWSYSVQKFGAAYCGECMKILDGVKNGKA